MERIYPKLSNKGPSLMKRMNKTLFSLSLLLSASFCADASNRVVEIEETLTNLSLADPSGKDVELQSLISELRRERNLLLEEARKSRLAHANHKFLQGDQILPRDVNDLGEDEQLKLALLMSQKETAKLSTLDRLKEVVRKGGNPTPEDFESLKAEEEFELIRYMSEIEHQEKVIEPFGGFDFEDEINQDELYQLLDKEEKEEKKDPPLQNIAPVNPQLEKERKIRKEQDEAFEKALRIDILKEKMKPLAMEIEVLGKALEEEETAYKLAEEKALSALSLEIHNLSGRIKAIEIRLKENLPDTHPLVKKLKELEEMLQKARNEFLGERAEQLMQIVELGQKKSELEKQFEEMKREVELLNQ